MAGQLVPVVQADGVGALQPGHPRHQVGVGGFDHQMVMVAHQAKGMHLPIRLLTGLGQGLDEVMPVHVVQEDVLALVATAHHVIHGAGILDSHFARHDAKGLDELNPKVKHESKIYGLTPSTRWFDPIDRDATAAGSAGYFPWRSFLFMTFTSAASWMTSEWGGTLAVRNTLAPMVLPAPTTVSPPMMVAPA